VKGSLIGHFTSESEGRALIGHADRRGLGNVGETVEVRGLLGLGSAFVVGLPDSFHLKRELQSANSIKLATAFADWSGWKHLLPHVNKTAGTVKLLTGLSFCQTEPQVLSDWCDRSQDGLGPDSAFLPLRRDSPRLDLLECPRQEARLS
jgi:hypothetical protein